MPVVPAHNDYDTPGAAGLVGSQANPYHMQKYHGFKPFDEFTGLGSGDIFLLNQ